MEDPNFGCTEASANLDKCIKELGQLLEERYRIPLQFVSINIQYNPEVKDPSMINVSFCFLPPVVNR